MDAERSSWTDGFSLVVSFFVCVCVCDQVPAHLTLPSTTPPSGSHHHHAHPHHAHLSPLRATSASMASHHDRDHLPTKPVLRKHGKLISFFRFVSLFFLVFVSLFFSHQNLLLFSSIRFCTFRFLWWFVFFSLFFKLLFLFSLSSLMVPVLMGLPGFT